MSGVISFSAIEYVAPSYNAAGAVDFDVLTNTGSYAAFDDGSETAGPANSPVSGTLNWRLDVIANDAFNPNTNTGCYPGGSAPSSLPQFCVQYFTTAAGRWRRVGTFDAGNVGGNNYSAGSAMWGSWSQVETF
ncbi:hypothetical protein [Burkholderia pseudomallei]|uniref:hypothetical protein n=1 Tax=Burkholderia pseudomallei TaxID=28450 RepID=UPI0011854159|nr:hypothetical protein [Burkholderia pseudomallei]